MVKRTMEKNLAFLKESVPKSCEDRENRGQYHVDGLVVDLLVLIRSEASVKASTINTFANFSEHILHRFEIHASQLKAKRVDIVCDNYSDI